jgi:hypothetical protein
VPALRELRRRDAYHAFRLALGTALRRADFRVCHLSLQTGHVHLVVEADDYLALARGMQGLEISAAQRLNRALSRRLGRRRRGTVFPDRYHARVRRTPTEVRRCLRYVLCNWRRHREDRGTNAPVDPYSTAHGFDGFRDHLPGQSALGLLPLPIARPRSWLLASGWRLLGLIGARDRPGPGSASGSREPVHLDSHPAVIVAREARLHGQISKVPWRTSGSPPEIAQDRERSSQRRVDAAQETGSSPATEARG